MLTSKVDLDDINAAALASNKKHFFTTFEHLNAHFGFRRGMLTGYLGSTGSGKSSLMKTLIMQSASTKDVNVVAWLSEETKENYAIAMHRYSQKTGVDISRINFFEESELDHSELPTHESFLEAFREIVTSSFADIVLIDNVTTSRLYSTSTGIAGQNRSVEFLKELAKKMNISIVYMAHTANGVSDNMGRLITTEDIRNSKELPIQTSYFYTLQKFTNNGVIHLFLRTLKHRDHPDGGGSYVLKFDRDLGVYIGDSKIEFDVISEVFKTRDRLGGK